MQAAIIETYGRPAVLRVLDQERPEPGPGQVLIRQMASSLNPIDYRMRSGYGRVLLGRKRGFELPLILGRDACGIVEAVGRGVQEWQPGDAVYGTPDGRFHGTHAEYCLAKASQIARKPASLDFRQAAALPYVACTSWSALARACGLNPGNTAGKRVFIQGGGGGIGAYAIQLIKAWGGTVATTCASRNVERVSALGADQVIDYQRQDYSALLRDFDVALETVGGPLEDRTLSILRRDGRAHFVTLVHPILQTFDTQGLARGVVSVATMHTRRKLQHRRTGIHYHLGVFRPDRNALETTARLVDAGRIRPNVDRVFPLSGIARAHAYCESGQASGKVVIDIAQTTSEECSHD